MVSVTYGLGLAMCLLVLASLALRLDWELYRAYLVLCLAPAVVAMYVDVLIIQIVCVGIAAAVVIIAARRLWSELRAR